MLKEKYERFELEIIRFHSDDIITTTGDRYEGWNTGTGGSGGSSGANEGWNPYP